jgi:trehalose synthase-fused probable maltokinase
MADLPVSLPPLDLFDEQRLLEFVVDQRWFGARSREVAGATVRDVAFTGRGDHVVGVVLLDVWYDAGTHDVYQLVVGTDGDGTGDRLGTFADRDLFEVGSNPVFALELALATNEGETVVASAGTVAFHALVPLAVGDSTTARRLGAEQSNTSVVLDEMLLKTYRRVEAGLNPELEMLLFLSERGFPNVPQLLGWYGYSGSALTATLGTFQRFVPDAVDGWSLALQQVRTDPDGFVERIARLGHVLGAMHCVLASDASEADFAPEEPGPEALGILAATIEDELDAVFSMLPENDEAVAPIEGRANDIRDRLRYLARGEVPAPLIRTHGDFHLGQALWAAGDWTIVDFEGEPARTLTERRRKQTPLRDVAGLLRSLSYISAALRDEGATVPDWEAVARERFVESYRETAAAGGVLGSSVDAQNRLISFFELEKAIYELRYELDHRPDWLHVPAEGIAQLLDEVVV